jgi:Flp pilus assembly protein TadG
LNSSCVAKEDAMVAGRGFSSNGPLKPVRIAGRGFTKKLRVFLRSGDQGLALIEIAMVMPIFLILMLGIFTFSITLNNQLTLTQAVGTGAQYLQQIRTNTTDPCADTFAKIKSAAYYLDSTKISITVTMNGTTPTQTGNSCSNTQSNLVQGAPVSVAATYPCNLTIYGVNYAPGCLLHAQVTEYEY